MSDVNQVRNSLKEELEKGNPSPKKIVSFLFNLRLYKLEIKHGPKDKWRYLPDTEFFDIVGELFNKKPEFYLKSLYKPISLKMRKIYGIEKRIEMDKYIVEKYCLYHDEQILYECKGNVTQTEFSEQKTSGKYKIDFNPIKISTRSGYLFLTNYRIIAQGMLTVSGGKSSKRAERRNDIIESAPLFGYQFPIKNHTGLNKINLLHMIAYFATIENYTYIITIKPIKSLRREEHMNKIFDLLRKDANEVLNVINEVYETEILEKNKRISVLSILKELRKSEEFQLLSDSDYFEIVTATFKLDPRFFISSIYPKMTSWKFPSFMNIKKELFEILRKEGVNIDEISS